MKKRLLLILVAVFIAIGLSGCGSEPEGSIIGRWRLCASNDSFLEFEFNEDGKFLLQLREEKDAPILTQKGTYVFDGENLTLTSNDGEELKCTGHVTKSGFSINEKDSDIEGDFEPVSELHEISPPKDSIIGCWELYVLSEEDQKQLENEGMFLEYEFNEDGSFRMQVQESKDSSALTQDGTFVFDGKNLTLTSKDGKQLKYILEFTDSGIALRENESDGNVYFKPISELRKLPSDK